MQATSCSKYIPKRGQEDKDVAFTQLHSQPIVTKRPPPPKIRSEVEPKTTSMTLYGMSQKPANPHPDDPKTFDPKDWKSVTKSHYPAKTNADFVGKGQLVERANFSRSSNWGIGNPDQPNIRRTQNKDDFPRYERDRYMARTEFNIGGAGAKKVHSDVDVAGAEDAHARYEPMQLRQFQKIPFDTNAAKQEASHRKSNKLDMISSHFVVGVDRVDYRPVAASPIQSQAPKIKNRPPSGVPADRNPHLCKSVNDARPDSAQVKAAFAAKNKSHVPVLQPGGSFAGITTTTQQSLPAFTKRREMNQASAGGAAFGSSLNLGCGSATNYVTMTKSQYRGIYYEKDQ